MSRLITKNSTVAAKVPLTTDLLTGELALNAADGNVFLKTTANVVVDIAPVKLSTVFPMQVAVTNLAALKTLSKVLVSSAVTKGYYTAFDGGDAEYFLDAADTTSTGNDVSIVVAADGGRWKIKHGGVINAKQAGAKGDGTTLDRARLQAGLDAVEALGIGNFRIDRSSGAYMVDQSVLIPPNTKVFGTGTIKAVQTGYNGVLNAPWDGNPSAAFTLPLFRNKGFLSATRSDKKISVDGLTFDFGTLTVAGGGLHHISIRRATDCNVTNCTFFGGENCVSFINCRGTFTGNNRGYDFINCAWDHWDSPQDAVVMGNYAETANSVQMSNFNPEPTNDLTTTGLVADGYTLTGNEFYYKSTTGGSYVQIEPLIEGNGCRNVTVTGNIFRNTSLVLRRNTSNVVANGNVFVGGVAANTSSMIMCNPLASDTPSSISILNNTFVDPRTSAANLAVILLRSNGFICEGNTVSGTNHYCALDTSTYSGSVGKNQFSVGTSGRVQIGSGQFPQWLSLTMQNAWVSFGAPRAPLSYYVDYSEGKVHLRGSIKSGTNGTTAATLPSHLGPENMGLFPTCANGSFGILVVNTDGTLVPSAGSNADFSVDGISFRYKP